MDIWEVRHFIDRIGGPLSDTDIEEVFTKLDTDEDGFISCNDFISKIS